VGRRGKKMLDKIIKDLLFCVLRRLQYKDIVAVALTCKQVLELCRESRGIFPCIDIYGKWEEKKIRFGSTTKLIVESRYDKREALEVIRKYNRINKVTLVYEKEVKVEKNIRELMGRNIRSVEIRAFLLKKRTLKELVKSDIIESLVVIMPNRLYKGNICLTVHDGDSGTHSDFYYYIRRIGKNYKRLTIMIEKHSESIKWSEMLLEDSLGLQMLEICEEIWFEPQLLVKHAATLKHLFINGEILRDASDMRIFGGIKTIRSVLDCDLYDFDDSDLQFFKELEVMCSNLDQITFNTFKGMNKLRCLHIAPSVVDNGGSIDIDYKDLVNIRCLYTFKHTFNTEIGTNIVKLRELRVLVINKYYNRKDAVYTIGKSIEEIVPEEYNYINKESFPNLKLLIFGYKIWFEGGYPEENNGKSTEEIYKKYVNPYDLQTYYEFCREEN
jgi:hypothetical protein